MANEEHLDLLKRGNPVWNKWRKRNWKARPEFSEAVLYEEDFIDQNLLEDLYEEDLYEAGLSDVGLRAVDLISTPDLSGADLGAADLSGTDLSGADLSFTNLSGADLSDADLSDADLSFADLSGANLSGADLSEANFSDADLSDADLSFADLSGARLIRTNLTNATLKESTIYGISVWDIQLDGTKQINLTITPADQPTITVDDLEVAQFIYLLLNNKKIRDFIDTITSKVVLILGRFTPERKAVLDAIRDGLRKRNYLPVLFDFEKPSSRDFTETVRTLAHLSRFIIADITNPSSIPQELQAIVPDLEVPVQPLMLEALREYSMFVDFKKYHWVLPVYCYTDGVSLLASLNEKVIAPAEQKAKEIAKRLGRP